MRDNPSVKDKRWHQLNKQQSANNRDAWGEGGGGTMTTVMNCGRGGCAEGRGGNGWQLRQWGEESDKREMDDDETVGG